jgi:hypothetical protein
MPLIINALDLHVLRALDRGETPLVASTHRVRLEMMRLVTDGPDGLQLAPAGQKAILAESNAKTEALVAPVRKRTASGRKRMLDRTLPLP